MKVYIRYLALILIFGFNFMSFCMEVREKIPRTEISSLVIQELEQGVSLTQEQLEDLNSLPVELIDSILKIVVKSYLKDMIDVLSPYDIIMDTAEVDSELSKFNKKLNYLRSVSKLFKDLIDASIIDESGIKRYIFKDEIERYKEEFLKEKFGPFIEKFKDLSQEELDQRLLQETNTLSSILIKNEKISDLDMLDLSNRNLILEVENILTVPEVQGKDQIVTSKLEPELRYNLALILKTLGYIYALVLLGVNPNIKFKSYILRFGKVKDSNLLMVASSLQALGLVKLLINKGVDVNAKSKYNLSALWIASFRKFDDVVNFLIKAGAGVNVQPNKRPSPYGHTPLSLRQTPLIVAVIDRSIKMVRLLLKHGADPSIRNKIGRTALYYAKRDPLMGISSDYTPEIKVIKRTCREKVIINLLLHNLQKNITSQK